MRQAALSMTRPLERPPLETLLARAAETASQIGPEFLAHAQKLDDLRQRFCEGRFHLAVLGQFKRGKSTLLNALTGDPVLPVGVVPLTAAPTFLRYGQTPAVHVLYRDDRPPEEFSGTGVDERRTWLADFVTEKGNPQNRRGVAAVQVELPAPILAGGVVLIDTPGIGSTYRHNTTATLDFLTQCDAALFLVSADPPITEVELAFLRQVKEKVPRLFFVLNKIDYLSPDELAEALAFYRDILAQEAGRDDDFRVFCVSARRGLAARTAADEKRWRDSGMAELEEFLVDFLAREKFAALSEAISRRAVDFIDAALMEAGIVLQALKLPRQELEEKITLFEKSLQQAESDRRLVEDVLAGDKKRVAAFVEEQARDLRQEAEEYFQEVMESGGSSARSGIQQAWAEAIPAFFEQRQEALNRRVRERLVACLEPHEERLQNLVETLRRAAADLFRVSYRPLVPAEALEIRRKPYWVLNTWNTDPLPVLQSLHQRLDRLVRRNVENIRWSTLQNINISFAGFARRTRERLDETVAATRGAMEAARARRRKHGDSVDAEVRRVAEHMALLEALKSEAAGMAAPGGNRP